MTTSSAKDILRVPVNLVWNPTSLSTAFPHGGTALGITRAEVFRPNIKTRLVTAEEWGGTTVEGIYVGDAAIFAAVLRSWDREAISNIFLDSAAGATTGRQYARGRVNTESYRAGTSLSGKAGILLASPESPNQHPCVLMYRAVPVPDVAQEMQLCISQEVGLAVAFYATPDSSGNTYRIGLLADLSL